MADTPMRVMACPTTQKPRFFSRLQNPCANPHECQSAKAAAEAWILQLLREGFQHCASLGTAGLGQTALETLCATLCE